MTLALPLRGEKMRPPKFQKGDKVRTNGRTPQWCEVRHHTRLTIVGTYHRGSRLMYQTGTNHRGESRPLFLPSYCLEEYTERRPYNCLRRSYLGNDGQKAPDPY